MAYDGSGTFNRLYNWQQDAANGIFIRADRMDAEMNGFAQGLSLAILRDGQAAMQANFDMGNFQIKNLADPVLATDAVTKSWANANFINAGVGSVGEYGAAVEDLSDFNIPKPAGFYRYSGGTANKMVGGSGGGAISLPRLGNETDQYWGWLALDVGTNSKTSPDLWLATTDLTTPNEIGAWVQVLTEVSTLNADNMTTGTLGTGRIPDLSADKITSGQLATGRIPDLGASKITSGVFNIARIPDFNADKIVNGTIALGRLPNLPASQVTSGEFDVARIPDLAAGKITGGRFTSDRLPNNVYFAQSIHVQQDTTDTPGNGNTVNGMGFGSSYMLSIGSPSSPAMTLNRNTTTGTLANFRYNGVNLVGSIGVSASTTNYNTSSDHRLKENVESLTYATDILMALNPVTYTAKVDGVWYDGFLAHEVQPFVPWAVTGEYDGEEMQSMDYSRLTPLLTAGFQEHQQTISNILERVAQLESALNGA